MLRFLGRLPFTLVMLAIIAALAVLTDTIDDPLAPGWLDEVGFAPAHLSPSEWLRIFTSAVITHGEDTLLVALVMVALCVGSSERLHGTLLTAATFWGVHLLTLLSVALLVAYPLQWFDQLSGAALVPANDVGPSAGYYGCLGLALTVLAARYRGWVLGLVGIWLLVRMLIAYVHVIALPAGFTADLAHLIAFALGCVIGLARRKPVAR